MILYMVIERFKNRDGDVVYRRAREKGRMLPDGVAFVDSWVEPNLDRCFQLMKADNVGLLHEWAEKWRDIVDFEFVEVIPGRNMAERMRE